MIKRPGLTLVEMMITLAITAMLTAGALRLITRLSQNAAAMESAAMEMPAPHEAALARLLEEDLQQARRMRLARHGFELQTVCALNRQSLEVEHRPITVGYQVQQVGQRKWLLRIQQDESSRLWSEKVLCDIQSIEVSTSGGPRASLSSNWGSPGDVVAITLSLVEGPPMNFVFRRK